MKEIEVIRTFPNGKPLSVNFMDAVRSTQSEVIVRIDGDDSLDPDYISYGLHLVKKFQSAISPTYLIPEYWFTVNKPQGAGIFYPRSQFLYVGGYDETLDYQADLDFYIRYTQLYPIRHIDSLIYKWRVANGRSLRNTDKILPIRQQILERYGLSDEDVHHFGAYAYVNTSIDTS